MVMTILCIPDINQTIKATAVGKGIIASLQLQAESAVSNLWKWKVDWTMEWKN